MYCSVRAPNWRNREPQPYAAEAREFLRKKLVGKEVTVQMEYTRKVQATGAEGAPTGEVRKLLTALILLRGPCTCDNSCLLLRKSSKR